MFKIIDWLLGRGSEKTTVKNFLDEDVPGAADGLAVYLQRMAFWTCARKIGAAVSAVEWETYRQGSRVKAREHWAWNQEPNPNETHKEFFMHLVGQLMLHQEAVVVEWKGGRYIADSFSVEKKLSGNIYGDIISDTEEIPGSFGQEDVLHFSITGERIRHVLDAVAVLEGKLLKTAANAYIRDNGMRGILKVDDIAEADPDFEEEYEDLVTNRFKKFFTADNAILPMYNGFEYVPEKVAARPQSRDIRSLINDVTELTAQAIGIPPSIAAGEKPTDADFKHFMTFVVQPIVGMIAEELNRKLYGMDMVYEGTYITPNYAAVKYNDLFDVANPIDKLIGSGAFCVNDIRRRLGLDIIEEPWAWQHWMTKNYSSVKDLLSCVDGEGMEEKEKEEREENGEDNKTEGSR